MNDPVNIHKEIRQDLLRDEQSRNQALHRLIPLFNKFVKENVKAGDYDTFKKIQQEQHHKDATPEGYITNLAEAYLEPILPLDLEDPFKYQPIIDQLAKLYMESFL